MNKRFATSFLLAMVVNAGVLFALPMLAGAIEKAMPPSQVLEVRDIELAEIREMPPVAIPRRLVRENEETPVSQKKEPARKAPNLKPEKPSPTTAGPFPDLLENIELNLGTEALLPKIDLALPAAPSAKDNKPDGQAEPTGAKDIFTPDEVDRLPLKVHHVQPVYPSWALEQEVESEVLLNIVISAEGNVASLSIEESSGYKDLDQAAIEAVRKWRFAPALAGNKPVAVRALQKIRFSLK